MSVSFFKLQTQHGYNVEDQHKYRTKGHLLYTCISGLVNRAYLPSSFLNTNYPNCMIPSLREHPEQNGSIQLLTKPTSYLTCFAVQQKIHAEDTLICFSARARRIKTDILPEATMRYLDKLESSNNNMSTSW
jgi:hypothetical protein